MLAALFPKKSVWLLFTATILAYIFMAGSAVAADYELDKIYLYDYYMPNMVPITCQILV